MRSNPTISPAAHDFGRPFGGRAPRSVHVIGDDDLVAKR
jgi:hypothetical protein